MNLWSCLYTLIIGPLQLVLGILFSIVNKWTANPGLTIIIESLLLNILLYPLYRQADRIQAAATDKEKSMAPMTSHIRRSFKGDERMMMLQAYYRECGYSPLSILKTSLPVLLQIPFFLAAYNMLSSNSALDGSPFGPISDLGLEDGLLAAGPFTVNLLPVLMTLINILSGYIYARRQPIKVRLQLYLMAAVFLAALYKSPSGLVLYWTFNNIFALIKNAYFRIAKPAPKKSAGKISGKRQDFMLFLFVCLSCAMLVGYYIPALILSISTQEFINLYNLVNPLRYVLSSALSGLGLFVLWPLVFYLTAEAGGRKAMNYVMTSLFFCMLITSQLFSNDFGVISKELVFYDTPVFTAKSIIINLLACALAVFMAVVMIRLLKNFTKIILIGLTAVLFIAGSVCAVSSDRFYRNFISNSVRDEQPQFTMSKEGTNVVVIMLDRAMGPMIPYLFNDNASLTDEYDGFTYYGNTISFGPNTNFSTPSLFGGYEYTPAKLNERSDESLADKQDEAISVLPEIFTGNNYSCTFINPTYAGYQWIPDLTVFDDMEGVKAYNTLNRYAKIDYGDTYDATVSHNLFCYSLFKSAAVLLQPLFYDDGNYNDMTVKSLEYTEQRIYGTSVAAGHNMDFEMSYYALKSLKDMTVIDNGASDNVLLYTCDCTHDTALLTEPGYEIADTVDNTAYDAANTDRFTLNGRTMIMNDDEDYSHYESDMAALKALGEWFDYLRDNDLYDNTRIIIVSDHGNNLGEFDELEESDLEVPVDAEAFTPLLMVKDFNSHGFTVSDDFMTLADTPYLATEGIISNPTNPFTGNEITMDDKQGPQRIISSGLMDINANSGTVFAESDWYTVQSDIWNKDNWKYAGRG